MWSPHYHTATINFKIIRDSIFVYEISITKDGKKINTCQKNAQELAICMHNKRRAKLGKKKETKRRVTVAKDKETSKAKENVSVSKK